MSRDKKWRGIAPLQLRIGKSQGNVHVHLQAISKPMCMQIPDVEIDLLDIAAYVYAADQAFSRGGTKEFEYGRKWRRHIRFEIAVRRPEVWQDEETREILTETLGFLVGGTFEFSFQRYRHPPPTEQHLFADSGAHDKHDYQEVMLFSGGLDSLGGAIQEILQGHRKVALVSHRPTDKIYARQRLLVDTINQRLKNPKLSPLHVAIRVNKQKRLTHDTMQRGRSFLFTAIASIVARLFKLNRIRFYENGVISLNLPISPQVLDTRATRTTHPQALRGLERLLRRVFGTAFEIQNPYLWKTRTQIISEIRASGHADMCALSSSCSRTMAATVEHPHCGRCSQCVDRRLGALAAGLSDAEDPADGYACDVMTGPRDGTDLTLIERYAGFQQQVGQMQNVVEFMTALPEATRVLPFIGLPAEAAANQVFSLYQQQSRHILNALESAVAREARCIAAQNIPQNSLLGIWIGYSQSSPRTNVRAPAKRKSVQLVLDEGSFSASFRGKSCFLGKTLEFHLLVRLNASPGRFVTYSQLSQDVWGEKGAGNNAIQRVAGNLRRIFRDSGFNGIEIDGTQRGNYRLVLC
jgi:7-cyano-7-deazaguanine synthase in queuosine biosynthesis